MAKRIVLTGGGTAGHVTPNLALIPQLLSQGYEIHYIGTEKGMERAMIEGMPGVCYHAVKSGKLRRYFSWQNFTDPFRVLYGAFQSFRLIGKIKPNVCFSKGGFVSVPVVFGAWCRGVPVVCHESDMTPGLANRICIRFAKIVATTFPECAATCEKSVTTGTPLRPELFTGDKEKGLALGGFSGRKPILLITGGSQGAQRINMALREALPLLLPSYDVLHLCGKGNLDASLEGKAGYCQIEFLTDEMPHAMAAADLVISRAGSNTICELQALEKPMLLIPYPKGATSRGDQIDNAKSMKKRGLCHVLYQEDMTKETLASAVESLASDSEHLVAAMKASPPADGTLAVLNLIQQVEKN